MFKNKGFPDLYGRLSTIKLEPDYFLNNVNKGFHVDSNIFNKDLVNFLVNNLLVFCIIINLVF